MVKANIVVAPPIRKMDVGLQTNVHLEVSAGASSHFIKRSNKITMSRCRGKEFKNDESKLGVKIIQMERSFTILDEVVTWFGADPTL